MSLKKLEHFLMYLVKLRLCYGFESSLLEYSFLYVLAHLGGLTEIAGHCKNKETFPAGIKTHLMPWCPTQGLC